MSPSGVGIKVKSKISQGKSDETESKSYSDNIDPNVKLHLKH